MIGFRVHLDSGATLDVVAHALGDVAWNFTYNGRYWKPEEPEEGTPEMAIRYSLSVRYINGKLATEGIAMNELRPSLTMHVTLPKKRGVKWAYGADVSPGSEAWYEFSYLPASAPVHLDIAPDVPVKALRLAAVYGGEMGKLQHLDVPEPKPGDLVHQDALIDIPFPLADVVKPKFPGGPYQVPFLRGDLRVFHFEFPDSITKELR